MIPIGDYLFDAERLAFIPETISSAEYRRFLATPTNDDTALSIFSADRAARNPINARNMVFPHVGLCLSYDCQLRCTYCSFRSEEHHTDSIDEADIDAYLRHMFKAMIMNRTVTGENESLSIHITGGGEPTYHWKKLRCIVEYADKLSHESGINCSLSLTTNGILSTEQIAFISEHFQSVMVSYDGLPKIQDLNRHFEAGTGTSTILDNTLRLFSKALNGKGLIIRTTIWPQDYSQLREMAVQLFSNYSVSQWDIMPVLPYGRAEDTAADSKNYTGDFLNSYLDLLAFATEKYPEAVITTPFFPNSLAIQYCGALEIECPWLLPSGKIVACLESEASQPEIGHVSNGVVSFAETSRNFLAERVLDQLSECEECIAFRFCRGGCPVSQMRDSVLSKTARTWQCQQTVEYFQYVFSQILQNKTCFNWYVEPSKDNPQILFLRMRNSLTHSTMGFLPQTHRAGGVE